MRAKLAAGGHARVGIVKLHRILFAHDDFHPRAAEELLVFIKPRTVVEIAQHDQRVPCGQVRVHPAA